MSGRLQIKVKELMIHLKEEKVIEMKEFSSSQINVFWMQNYNI